ncbi:MAG: DNA-binding protein [Eubacterium sp.]
MEKKVIEQLLFDFYGELLTDKQKVIMDYYYNDDCNLAEIGDLVQVTRQGVYDAVKRSRGLMKSYEEKLGLVERFLKSQTLIDDVIQELEKVLQNEAVNKNKMLREELTDVKRKMTKISDDY